MCNNDLVRNIAAFIKTNHVKALCHSYRVQPVDATGELYLRLSRLASGKQIRNAAAWIRQNGIGVLRNWLRREIRTLV